MASLLDVVSNFVSAERERFPTGPMKHFPYGTAGFRDKADLLDCVIFRAALIAALRSKYTKATIGIVVTASHNPEQDNGIKFVDVQGQMLVEDWEEVATSLANAKSADFEDVAMSYIRKYNLTGNTFTPSVCFARDTRPSGEALVSHLREGLRLVQAQFTNYGVMTTPQLHYMVKCLNTNERYGMATGKGYLRKLLRAFKEVIPMDCAGQMVKVDAANGVAAEKLVLLNALLGGLLIVKVYNDGSQGKLNYMCGADYVKALQIAPNGLDLGPGDRCASFDGDADRIVYFYCTSEGTFRLLDGDKIASLMAMFIKEKMLASKVDDVSLRVVQTAYANGNSTNFITQKLDVATVCAKTGVKHLMRKAQDYDIGIFFEANGHGTVLYSDAVQGKLTAIVSDKESSQEAKDAAQSLLHLINLTNQTTGDAISDMLIVEAILAQKKWQCSDWDALYTELPNRQMKVKVKDRQVIETTDSERKCVSPAGLQESIDELVSAVPNGRSFVRPSGTEDVVRVYAEAETQELCDQLAVAVTKKVYEMAGGLGELPSL